MTLLTFEEREGILKTVCGRLHKEGIERLSLIGHFNIYTPLFYFTLAEPSNENFIFVTELFGSRDIKPGLFIGGIRRQYQGDYNGLSYEFIQGIPNIITKNESNLEFRFNSSKPHLAKELKNKFDNSLKYLEDITKFTVPASRRIPQRPETFSSIYHII